MSPSKAHYGIFVVLWSGIVFGTVPDQSPLVGIVTSVHGGRVVVHLLTSQPLHGSRLTIVRGGEKTPIAHIRILSTRANQIEATIIKATGLVRVGDGVLDQIVELPPVEPQESVLGQMPQEPRPLPAAEVAARLDLPSALPGSAGLFGEVVLRAAFASGRRFLDRERMVHAHLSPSLTLWMGQQQFRLKGRDPRNRFETDCLRYGIRYAFPS
ncbi:MAG: hypothetical protein RMK62_01805, partial [Armatimonadota bacterium]|nr:hypothetical protein [Armatimonadota bacterium]